MSDLEDIITVPGNRRGSSRRPAGIRERADAKTLAARGLHSRKTKKPAPKKPKKREKPFFGPGGAALSSAGVKWNTPKSVVDAILQALGRDRFDIDPCAPADGGGHVEAATRFTEKDDGLVQKWDGVMFVNPPYARGVTGKWARRCHHSVESGEAKIVIGLYPARVGTVWCHRHVFRALAPVLFFSRRLHFGDGGTPAPFDSMLVLWGADEATVAAIAAGFPDAVLVRCHNPGGPQ